MFSFEQPPVWATHLIGHSLKAYPHVGGKPLVVRFQAEAGQMKPTMDSLPSEFPSGDPYTANPGGEGNSWTAASGIPRPNPSATSESDAVRSLHFPWKFHGSQRVLSCLGGCSSICGWSLLFHFLCDKYVNLCLHFRPLPYNHPLVQKRC